MKKVFAFLSSNWIHLCWMIIALLFVVQLCGIKNELKRIAFGVGDVKVFLMEQMEGKFILEETETFLPFKKTALSAQKKERKIK